MIEINSLSGYTEFVFPPMEKDGKFPLCKVRFSNDKWEFYATNELVFTKMEEIRQNLDALRRTGFAQHTPDTLFKHSEKVKYKETLSRMSAKFDLDSGLTTVIMQIDCGPIASPIPTRRFVVATSVSAVWDSMYIIKQSPYYTGYHKELHPLLDVYAAAGSEGIDGS